MGEIRPAAGHVLIERVVRDNAPYTVTGDSQLHVGKVASVGFGITRDDVGKTVYYESKDAHWIGDYVYALPLNAIVAFEDAE